MVKGRGKYGRIKESWHVSTMSTRSSRSRQNDASGPPERPDEKSVFRPIQTVSLFERGERFVK